MPHGWELSMLIYGKNNPILNPVLNFKGIALIADTGQSSFIRRAFHLDSMRIQKTRPTYYRV
jgi:hypothetical protein